jgi:hypothetical protein
VGRVRRATRRVLWFSMLTLPIRVKTGIHKWACRIEMRQ